MSKLPMAALACAFTAAGIAAAHAGWDRVDSVRVDRDFDTRDMRGPDGRVRTLELTARRDSIFCRNVRVSFRSGREADVFSGRLREGEPQRVDLPGGAHWIDHISFECRARDRARLEVAADIDRGPGPGGGPGWGPGRGPGWGGPGFGAPGFGDGGGRRRLDSFNRWRQITTESFEGRRDRESVSPGWGGQRVEAMALRPVDGDARCTRVVVSFANGDRSDMDTRRYPLMREGLFYVFDFGDGRTVTHLSMACHGVGDRSVRIEAWMKRR